MFEPEKDAVKGVVGSSVHEPHSWLIVTVTNEDGRELGLWAGVQHAVACGIKKSDFSPGTITITGRPMRDGRTRLTG
jgi:hypothetical protein